jgi:hypothetical protein
MALRRGQDELGTGAPGRCLARCLLVAAVAAFAAGCQTVEHGLTTADYAGRPLAVATDEGAQRLQMEVELDASVREFVARHGRPDTLYVVDRQTVYLFYARKDLVGVFQREFVARSGVQTFRPIPGYLLKLLPEGDRDRILASRTRAASRRASRDARARHPSRAPGHPAAPKPGGGGDGWSQRRFDIDAIVSRLRAPLTAADTGVSGWQRTAGPGAVPQRTARSGDTRYEVRADAVTASTPIAAGRATTPRAARLAFVRVNRAVFGTQAGAVNRAVVGWAEQVARDPSGRTRIAQRVAGRTVRIHRLASRGWLVYSVYP